MTPRTLLTSIGATAIAFAIAIGVASGSSTRVDTLDSSDVAFAAPVAHDRVGAHNWSEVPPPASERLASWNDPCVVIAI
jgi:hypothetical protein